MKFICSHKKVVSCIAMVAFLVAMFAVMCFAAGSGDVAGAVESTWDTAKD